MRRLFILAVCILLLSSCAGLQQQTSIEPSRLGQQAVEAVNSCRPPQTGLFKPGPQFPEELRAKVAQELKSLEGRDLVIPITLNDEVRQALEYFINEAPLFIRHSLGRSTIHLSQMKAILREKGLPPDLAYLVLIESGFKLDAVSPAQAVGPWQFILPTAQRYGLRVDDWVDERMDPVKSTYAACAYLKYLYELFGSWYLASAAYNAGEGTILKALKIEKAENFWEIAGGKYLRDETKGYVPKFLAAVLIAKEPESYGFNGIEYEKPYEYDEVKLTYPTDLDLIARLSGTNETRIRELNPELTKWCTPLNQRDYSLRVPKGAGAAFLQNYAQLKPEDRLRTSIHVVRVGDNLKSIALNYGLSGQTLYAYNQLGSAQLRAGQKIRLPVAADVYLARQKAYEAKQAARFSQLKALGNKIAYTVRPGDNPWQIAQNYDLSWRDIALWNQISDVRRMMPGDKLVLYLSPPEKTQYVRKEAKDKADSSKTKSIAATAAPAAMSKTDTKPVQAGPLTYKVQADDTLWSISQRFQVPLEKIRSLNGLQSADIQVGQVLHLAEAAPPPHAKPTSYGSSPVAAVKKEAAGPSAAARAAYTVQKDDTLWQIAGRFKVTVPDLVAANNLNNKQLRPGDVLKVPAGAGLKPVAVNGNNEKPKNNLAAGQRQMREPAQVSVPDKSQSASSKVVSYKVQDGDTLWTIARRFGVNPDQIRSWNSMRDNRIKPGDVLTIRQGQS